MKDTEESPKRVVRRRRLRVLENLANCANEGAFGVGTESLRLYFMEELVGAVRVSRPLKDGSDVIDGVGGVGTGREGNSILGLIKVFRRMEIMPRGDQGFAKILV